MRDPHFIIEDLMHFLDSSPTSWHAVDEACKLLLKANFIELFEEDHWEIHPGGKYFVKRNGSSLCAFIAPLEKPKTACIAAAHTDSPALKLKPCCEYSFANYSLLASEIYGGPLLTSWYNRDLIVAGRVFYALNGKIAHSLIDIKEYPVTIPQLAIHLDKTANEAGPQLNKQLHLNALASLGHPEKDFLFHYISKKLNHSEILGADLFLVPAEKSSFIGFDKEMFASYRIDNLTSMYTALLGLITQDLPTKNCIRMAIFWDHEEIGSSTAQGAGSPFFNSVIERITLCCNQNREDFHRLLHNSVCLSIDQAHALHPNFPEKHDPHHMPLLGKGITIKYNANHRYSTSAETEAELVHLCITNDIPFQKFVSRNDMGCGSTIGPIHATVSGVKCIDIGSPQLSMHSARELASCQDQVSMFRLVDCFFRQRTSLKYTEFPL